MFAGWTKGRASGWPRAALLAARLLPRPTRAIVGRQ